MAEDSHTLKVDTFQLLFLAENQLLAIKRQHPHLVMRVLPF